MPWCSAIASSARSREDGSAARSRAAGGSGSRRRGNPVRVGHARSRRALAAPGARPLLGARSGARRTADSRRARLVDAGGSRVRRAGADQSATACATSSATMPKPPGVFRVLMLGDSFVEAMHVPLEVTLPARAGAATQRQCNGRAHRGDERWGQRLRHRERAAVLRARRQALSPDLVRAGLLSGQRREEQQPDLGGQAASRRTRPTARCRRSSAKRRARSCTAGARCWRAPRPTTTSAKCC